MKHILNQTYINLEYRKLQNFDPEIRDWELTVQSYHTHEQAESIKLRIKKYESQCDSFRKICQERVELIHQAYHNHFSFALANYPDNVTPESQKVELSLSDYEKIMKEIATKNNVYIDEIVEKEYKNFAFDPQKMSILKNRFRIEFATKDSLFPSIIIGWDTKSPKRYRINKEGIILDSEKEYSLQREYELET